MADLNPDNVKLRVRLVEMYLREGRRSDAVREAVELARRYEASGRIDEALQELARVRSAIPDDQAVSLKSPVFSRFRAGRPKRGRPWAIC